jgi:hypothetical protein
MTMASHDDLIFRHRGLGIIAVGWRAFLPKYCNSEVQCALAIALISASELYWTVASFHKDGEPFPMRVAIVLQAMTLVHWFECVQDLSQCRKYQALKQELIEEKTAMASLISMICDSSMHLSLDGETIIRSGPQFDSMMELSAEGTSLKSYLPGGEGEEKRLTDAFARARLGPVALPVTLLSKQQVPHKMDCSSYVGERSTLTKFMMCSASWLGSGSSRTLQVLFHHASMKASWTKCRIRKGGHERHL